MRWRHRRYRRYGLIALLLVVLLNSNTPSNAQIMPLQQYTLAALGHVTTAGGVNVPADVVATLGYNPGRSWTAGAPITDILTLDDVATSFGLEHLSLEGIAYLSASSLGSLSLDALPWLKTMTVGMLVEAIPQLRAYALAEVPLIPAILERYGLEIPLMQTVGSLAANSSFQALPLQAVDLQAYGLTAVPGLASAPLHNFAGWQQVAIADVPFLADVPMGAFPYPVAGVGVAARLDIVLGNREAQIGRTISGSQQQGFAVPCQQQCAHLELGQPYPGSRWIGGQQQVRGGYGFLSALNNGLEPTGRHMWGTDAFKVVVTDLDPAQGRAQLSLYFRVCVHSVWVNSCSPYFIGPVPFLPLQEGDWLPVG